MPTSSPSAEQQCFEADQTPAFLPPRSTTPSKHPRAPRGPSQGPHRGDHFPARQDPTTCADVHPRPWSTESDFFEVQELWRPTYRHRPSAASPAHRLARGQPPSAGRRARLRQLRQGRALHPLFAMRSTSRSSPSRTCRVICRGFDQEHAGVIRHGAKMSTPLRGDGAEDTGDPAQGVWRRLHRMRIGATSAPISTSRGPRPKNRRHGPEGAPTSFSKKEIRGAENPVEMRQKKSRRVQGIIRQFYVAAPRAYIDAVIEPSETRICWSTRFELSATSDNRPPKSTASRPLTPGPSIMFSPNNAICRLADREGT